MNSPSTKYMDTLNGCFMSLCFEKICYAAIITGTCWKWLRKGTVIVTGDGGITEPGIKKLEIVVWRVCRDLEILCILFYQVTHCCTKRTEGQQYRRAFTSIKHLLCARIDPHSYANIHTQMHIHICTNTHVHTHMPIHIHIRAVILEWVVFPFSRGFSQRRDQTQVPRIAGGFFTSWATREAQEYWSG